MPRNAPLIQRPGGNMPLAHGPKSIQPFSDGQTRETTPATGRVYIATNGSITGVFSDEASAYRLVGETDPPIDTIQVWDINGQLVGMVDLETVAPKRTRAEKKAAAARVVDDQEEETQP